MALDPYFQKTVLLLHGETVDPYGTYLVAGYSGKSLTPELGTGFAQNSPVAGTFDGAPAVRLASTSSLWAYGALSGVFDGDFTIEGWVYQTAYNTYDVFFSSCAGTTNDYYGCCLYYVSSGGYFTVKVRGRGGDIYAARPSLNTWHHYAITSSGGTVALYVDGVRMGGFTSANSTSYYACNGAMFGYTSGLSSTGIVGYGSDLRVYKGVAKYSGTSFTPPLRPGLPYGTQLDSSPKTRSVGGVGSPTALYTADSKFGGGCLRLDGASYLECAASADWQFDTGDFTVEAWVKITADSAPDGAGNKSAGVLLNDPGSGRASMEFLVFGDATRTGQGLLLGLDPGTGWVAVAAGSTISHNAWHHIAVCRAVGTVSFFLDGAYIGGGAFAHSVGLSTNKSRIGGRTGYGPYNFMMCGLIDDLRVTKGVARYTEDFTPPTEAFPDGQASVTGVVRDAEGNPCSRKVFAHSRGNGRLLGTAVSDPVTGVYEIAADETCYVVCLDSTSSYNAKIVDGVDPTA